ncbi:MAG: alkaline phosphatase family protein [Clostridia bacterium]|nr:alkaline phosphatase family protein [Clostridia bacterium]
MNKLYHPDYQKNCILGIPNSILKHYGAVAHHNTLPVLDERLKKEYKNVVLLVLDGMGISALNAHSPDGFLMKHCAAQLGSVYPCTTTSALTTYETGLTPLEHGWLGWAMYFPEINKSVELFTGKQSGTNVAATENNIVWDNIGFANLFEQIKKVDSSIGCCRVSPFGEYWTDTNEAICAHLETLCKNDGRRYIYAYHFQPDNDMHRNGCNSERVKADIVLFDKQIEQLCANLHDTLLVITADHGLTDVEECLIEDYPEINECLYAVPTREPRSLSFFVKPEFKEAFPAQWNRHFADDFRLMTSEEAINSGIFGIGTPHKRLKDFLGDYVALAIGKKMLWFRDEQGQASGHLAAHAGLLPDEMTVPLILIER